MTTRLAGMIAAAVLAAIVLAALLTPALGTAAGITQDRSAPFAPPGQAYWLGTDGFGRDEFARLLRGARVSLSAVVLATAIALACGLLSGAAAGYYGGWGDDWIARATELFQSLPWFYLVLAVRAFLPLSLPEGTALLAIAAITGFTG